MSFLALWFLVVFLPGLKVFSLVALVVLGIALAIEGMVLLDSMGEEWEKDLFRKSFKGMVFSFVLFGLLSLSIPNERQMVLIVGAKYATNNEQLKEIPDNLGKAVNAWLKALEEAAKNE